ncbi:MAG: efflux RND transporter permease subunit, partial [Pseudomonadota bacterium]
SLAVGLFIAVTLIPPAEYLPEGEEPKVFSRISAPPGYNLSTMEEIASELRQKMMPYLDTDPDDYDPETQIVPPLKYINQWVGSNGATIISEPKDPKHINQLMNGLDNLFDAYPGMRSFSSRGSIITSNSGGTRSVSLDISGPRLQTIYDVATRIDARANEVFDGPRIQSNPGTLALAQPLVEVRPNWERAAELGLNTETLGFTVAALTNGAFVDEFFLDDDKIDIYLYSGAGTEASLDNLETVLVYTPTGATIPLGSLATVVETANTSLIRRVNGRRTVTLNIIPPGDVPLETGVEVVRRDVLGFLTETGEIPGDVAITLSGAADQLDATREALSGNFAVAIIIVYLLLVAIFTHWGYPLLIMATIPLGVAGGFVGLGILNGVGALLPWIGLPQVSQSFDMISMLGFLILMGTVVNNPILIVHRAIENTRQGLTAVSAVTEAVQVRLRPIAMSTLTTFFGLAPLALIPGEGTELYRGVGVIVMFGILGSAVVALTLLPVLTVLALQWFQVRDKTPTPVAAD